MKQSMLNWGVLCVSLIFSSSFFAQKKGDKSAKLLNYTFDKLQDSDVEVSEEGQIGLLRGLRPSSQYPADAFIGSGDFGVGVNLYGYAQPKAFADEKFEGDDASLFRYGDKNLGYAGIVTYKQGKLAKERSYITIPFTDETGKKGVKMTAGKMYCIEMSVSMAEASKFATNNIGLMFVKNFADYQTENIEEPSGPFYDDNSAGRVIYNTKNRIYNSYGGWDKVCNIYRAKGDETGVVIGNFAMNDKTKYEVNKKIDPKKMERDGEELAEVPVLQPMAYYYIDNVRIKEVDSKDKCYCIKRDTTTMIQLSRTQITKDMIISDKLSAADNVEAQVIYYSQGESKPDETGKEIIDFLASYLKENEGASVEIFSNNDQMEDSLALEFADDEDIVAQFANLSEKRIDYIKERLMERFEISASRIIPRPMGASNENTKEIPADADDDMRYAYNRRVTFVIK
ncbi:MAG: hypothetical protein FJZ80_01700 [Bacteroidetes bacterium]|nr:hypothetical protein [Bacteroidota bacterium]MBM3424851.1 hypothetical protein [Bacteroidota bacterium]